MRLQTARKQLGRYTVDEQDHYLCKALVTRGRVSCAKAASCEALGQLGQDEPTYEAPGQLGQDEPASE